MNKRYLVTVHSKIKFIGDYPSEAVAKRVAKELFEASTSTIFLDCPATVTEFSYCEAIEIPKE